MHILIDMSSLLIVILIGNMFLLRLLPTLGNWSLRQRIHLFILAIPLVSVVLVIGGIVHVIMLYHVVRASRWDYILDFVSLLFFGCLLLGATFMGGMRLLLMKRLMQHREIVVDLALQARVVMDWEKYNPIVHVLIDYGAIGPTFESEEEALIRQRALDWQQKGKQWKP